MVKIITKGNAKITNYDNSKKYESKNDFAWFKFNYDGGKSVMGDSFEVGDVGAGATIVNKSWVNDSFNKVEREYGEETKKALEQVSDFIQKSNNPSAVALFNGFNQELRKPQHEKSTLKGIWDNIVNVLPSVATISGAISQITKLFV